MESCLLCQSEKYRIIKKGADGRHIGMCSQCHFVQVYPRVTKGKYDAVHFDEWDHDNPYIAQLAAHKAYFRNLVSYLLPFVKKRTPIRLLDVGCAVGVLVMVAQEQGIEAEGIDIAKTAVSYAKKLHLPVFQGTCETWFGKKRYRNRYDMITALEIIEHEEDPLRMMQIIWKMLRSDGTVAITTPNFNTIYRVIMGDNWVGYQHHEHLWFFTPESITRLFKQAGFSDIRVRRDFFRPYSLSFMFQRLGDYIPVLRPITTVLMKGTKRITVTVPFNPWGDMLVTARK